MDINLNDVAGLKVQTAAEWAEDSDVYPEQYFLVTSDEFFDGTNQRKFKISDGVLDWGDLDYLPLGASGVISVSGDGVDNTDPENPIINLPTLKVFNYLNFS